MKQLLIRKLLLIKYNAILFESASQIRIISANVTTQDFDGIYNGTLPNLVIVGLVSDKDYCSH